MYNNINVNIKRYLLSKILKKVDRKTYKKVFDYILYVNTNYTITKKYALFNLNNLDDHEINELFNIIFN